MNNKKLYLKRSDLVVDYISQILVYGSNTKGSISFDKNKFDDGSYLILTVSVIKNSYFRWHDLGILASESIDFYKLLLDNILDKFKVFNISFDNGKIIIKSLVNGNELDINFTFTNQKEKDWFLKEEKLFYNK